MLRNNVARKALIPLLATALLSSCYVNQAIYDPYSYAPKNPDTEWKPTFALLKQDQTYTPALPDETVALTLAEIIDISLKNNPDTAISWAQARAAAAQYGESQAPALPTLNGLFYYTRDRDFSLTATGTHTAMVTEYYPQLQAEYIIWDFGQRRETSLASRDALYQANFSHNWELQTVIDTVTTNYYDYLYQEQLLTSLGEDVQTAQITLDAATQELRMGVAALTDVLQAKTQLLEKQMEQTAQKQVVNQAYNTLVTSMGVPAERALFFQGLPSQLPNSEVLASVNALIDSGLMNRSDMRAAMANVSEQQHSVAAAALQYYPTITYNFDLGKTYYNGVKDNFDWTSTFNVQIPIFEAFQDQNALRLAQANLVLANEQLRQVKLKLTSEISTYYTGVKNAFDSLQFAVSYLEAAAKQYTISLSKYKAGTNTILDVVSAQSALANARAQKAKHLRDWYVSLANLTYAMGLLRSSGEQP